MAGSLQEIEAALAELDGVAVLDRACAGTSAPEPSPEIDARAGALGKFVMAGDEVGVQVRFDDVLDLQPLFAGGVEVDVDVALRVDHRRDAFRPDQVGSVRQTAQKEVFDENGFHGLSLEYN